MQKGTPRTSPSIEFDVVRIGGFDTVVATRVALAERMIADVLAARRTPSCLPKLVFSSNGQGISLAATDRRFAEAMAQADVIHADGMSVVMSSRLLTRSPLPERVATTDFFHDAARAAQAAGARFFLLGGKESENVDACAAARRLYPHLIIAGRHHGYFADNESERICEAVVAAETDVLWVALGKPRQELWSLENRERLQGVTWIKTCGGLYAFLAGHSQRAPLWVQRTGLEWAFRAMQEPSRLGWRYLMTNPHALWRILIDSRNVPPLAAANARESVTQVATRAGHGGPVKREG